MTLSEHHVEISRSLVQGSRTQSDALRMDNDFEPSAGSKLAIELAEVEPTLAGAWGEDAGPIRQTFLAALTGLAAVDHHLAALDLISTTTIALSGETVARAAMEAAARAWWLLDPEIDGRTRAARGMTERMYSLRELIKVLRGLASEKDRSDLGEDRRAEAQRAEDALQERERRLGVIVETARAHDFEVLLDRKGKPEALGERRPYATDLIENLYSETTLLGALVFRAFSAKGHATLFGLMNTLTVIGAPDSPTGEKIGRMEATTWDRTMMMVLATMAHNYANDRLLYVTSWDDWAWSRWRQHVIARVREIILAGSSDPDVTGPPEVGA